MERLSDIESLCTWTVSVSMSVVHVYNIIAMFYKYCKVFPVFPPLEANKTHFIVCQLVYSML